MPTGPKNAVTQSKTLRVPHAMVDKIEEISEREGRKFANTVIEILREHLDTYDARSRKRYEDLAGQAKKEDNGGQEPAEEVKDKPGVKKKRKESAS